MTAEKSTPVSWRRMPAAHPLGGIDQFILACGWKQEPKGFVPPPSWRPQIAAALDAGMHWRREHAAMICIRYYEALESRFDAKCPTDQAT